MADSGTVDERAERVIALLEDNVRTEARWIGIVASCVGVGALLVSYFHANWFTARQTTFHFMHQARFRGAYGIAPAYWHWLGYALMAAVVTLTVAANVPTRVQRFSGLLAAAAGIVGAAITIAALFAHSSLARVLRYSSIGVYLALFGFVACVAGTLASTRRSA